MSEFKLARVAAHKRYQQRFRELFRANWPEELLVDIGTIVCKFCESDEVGHFMDIIKTERVRGDLVGDIASNIDSEPESESDDDYERNPSPYFITIDNDLINMLGPGAHPIMSLEDEYYLMHNYDNDGLEAVVSGTHIIFKFLIRELPPKKFNGAIKNMVTGFLESYSTVAQELLDSLH